MGLVIAAITLLPWIINVEQSTDGSFLYKAMQEDFYSEINKWAGGSWSISRFLYFV